MTRKLFIIIAIIAASGAAGVLVGRRTAPEPPAAATDRVRVNQTVQVEAADRETEIFVMQTAGWTFVSERPQPDGSVLLEFTRTNDRRPLVRNRPLDDRR